MPGYRGVNCSEICLPGYFGRLCTEQCHCSSDMYCEPTAGCLCNTTSVNCTDPGQSSYLQLKKLSRHQLTRVILKHTVVNRNYRYHVDHLYDMN